MSSTTSSVPTNAIKLLLKRILQSAQGTPVYSGCADPESWIDQWNKGIGMLVRGHGVCSALAFAALPSKLANCFKQDSNAIALFPDVTKIQNQAQSSLKLAAVLLLLR